MTTMWIRDGYRAGAHHERHVPLVGRMASVLALLTPMTLGGCDTPAEEQLSQTADTGGAAGVQGEGGTPSTPEDAGTGGSTAETGGSSPAGGASSETGGDPATGGTAAEGGSAPATGGTTPQTGGTATGGTSSSGGTSGGAGGLSHTNIMTRTWPGNLEGSGIFGALQANFISGIGGCAKALSVYAPQVPANYWDYQVNNEFTYTIHRGDVLYLQFWARSYDFVPMTISWELAGAPYDNYYRRQLPLTASWTLYRLRMTAPSDLTTTGALRLQLGYAVGTTDLACLTLDDYGPTPDLSQIPETTIDDTWGGYTWDKAAWEAKADQNIQLYRKASYAITVTDGSGAPLPGVTVHVLQTKHKFIFGTAVGAEAFLTNPTYRDMVVRLFNQATLENDLKWVTWDDMTKRQATLDAIALLASNGLTVKGHNLLYPSIVPSWVSSLPPADIPEAVRSHVEGQLGVLQGSVIDWDVVNEPVSAPGILNLVGNNNQLLTQTFQWARQYAPAGVDLFVNDIGIENNAYAADPTTSPYYLMTKWMIDNNVPFEGAGQEGHMQRPFVAPPRLWKVFDAFGALNKKVRFTELDVYSEDVDLQAEVLRLTLKAAFSHPAVDGATMWGFWAGQHWRATAALYDYDFSPKPAGTMFETLVHHTWWTDELCQTDAQGQCSVPAFLGNHTITGTLGALTAQTTTAVATPGVSEPVTLILQ